MRSFCSDICDVENSGRRVTHSFKIKQSRRMERGKIKDRRVVDREPTSATSAKSFWMLGPLSILWMISVLISNKTRSFLDDLMFPGSSAGHCEGPILISEIKILAILVYLTITLTLIIINNHNWEHSYTFKYISLVPRELLSEHRKKKNGEYWGWIRLL